LPRQRRKKKAMQAMLAVASVPRTVDVAAMFMVVMRILRGMGQMQFGAGLEAWKSQRSQLRQKSMVPSTLR